LATACLCDLSNEEIGVTLKDNLNRPIYPSPLNDESADFFSLKRFEFKKEFNKPIHEDKAIAPQVYWRFIEEVSAFTKK